MILLFNVFTLIVCVAWNLFIVIGTIYLIEDFHWSPWTLVATLCFLAKWTPYKLVKEEPKEEDKPRIILNDTDCGGAHHDN
jgi:hypothetical protein